MINELLKKNNVKVSYKGNDRNVAIIEFTKEKKTIALEKIGIYKALTLYDNNGVALEVQMLTDKELKISKSHFKIG